MTRAPNKIKSGERYQRLLRAIVSERERLYVILDDDPYQAVLAARSLVNGPDLDDVNVNMLRASIFIDGGERLNDAGLVLDGVTLFRQIDPAKNPDVLYNIANGLAALARIQRDGMLGQLSTGYLRQEARGLFQDAAERSDDVFVRSSSYTNQANLLKDSFRWIEAYDAYAAALGNDPKNAIALSGISNLIQWRLNHRVEGAGALRRAAVRYLLRARDSAQEAHRYGGVRGVKRVEELMSQFKINADTQPEPESPPASPYATFVRRHRLALCLTPESAGGDISRWDHLAIKSIIEPINTDSRVPTIFAIWNMLKADFLAARWLAFTAIADQITETGFYSDTLDYANYGANVSGLILAQKATLDILDKIAVAATEYFALRGDPQRVYFGRRWHVMDSKRPQCFSVPVQWQAEVESEIKGGNANLIAIAELAQDYASGYLRSKRYVRNSATHGFIALHETPLESHCRPSTVLERFSQSEFERLTIESLQLVRAALLYFHGAISSRERRNAAGHKGRVGHLAIPSHHEIRGR